jgi:hypothetical protein
MTVLFFSLYLACIWSILGTWLCRISFVVFRHRLAVVNAGCRVRVDRGGDRKHAVQVQFPNARGIWRVNGEATDMTDE